MDAPDQRIAQHRNVVEAARQAGVSKIVYTSIQRAEENTDFTVVGTPPKVFHHPRIGFVDAFVMFKELAPAQTSPQQRNVP